MLRDMFGNIIKVGDFIVYSAADGRSACMRFGLVTKLRENSIQALAASNFYGPHSKVVTLSYLDRCVVIPESVPNQAWIDSLEDCDNKNADCGKRYEWVRKYEEARR